MQHNFRQVRKYLSIIISTFMVLISVFSTVSANAAPNILWGCAINETQSTNDSSFGCPQKASLITGPWVLDSWEQYHTDWLSKFILPQNQSKTPFIYSYIIAGQARRDLGLQDCNVNYWWSLCFKGASYLRSNRGNVIQGYKAMATQIKRQMPNRKVMIQVEPDFYQYASGNNQQGGKLSFSEAYGVMNEITDAIKSILPNAELVMDVSPWTNDLSGWSRGFRNFSYSGIVGKWFDAWSKVDGKSYGDMSNQTGHSLIVNTAHGVGGSLNWYNRSWEFTQSGVAGVIQSSQSRQEYDNFLNR